MSLFKSIDNSKKIYICRFDKAVSLVSINVLAQLLVRIKLIKLFNLYKASIYN